MKGFWLGCVFLATLSTGSVQDERGKSIPTLGCLKGVKHIWVRVGSKGGLADREILKGIVELPLRSAGVPADEAPSKACAILDVLVDRVGTALDVRLQCYELEERGTANPYLAAIGEPATDLAARVLWEKAVLVSGVSGDGGSIEESRARSLSEMFANDYLKANPKK